MSPALSFQQVEIRRMPGFPSGRGFTVSGLCPGVNIIYGPNASGKTTLARAIQILLYGVDPSSIYASRSGSKRFELPVELGAQVQWLGRSWTVQYRYENNQSRPIWQLVGEAEPSACPVRVSKELSRQYLFGLPELLAAEEKGTDLAMHLLRELSGGYQLQEVPEQLGFKEQPSRRDKSNERIRKLEEAKRRLRQLQDEQKKIFDHQGELEELRRQLNEAKQAVEKLPLLQKALNLLEAQNQYEEAKARLAPFPPALAQMTGQETQQLEEIQKQLEEKKQQKIVTQDHLQRVTTQLAELGLPTEGLQPEELARCRSQLDQLRRSETQIHTLREELQRAEAERQRCQELLGTWAEERKKATVQAIGLEAVQQLSDWGRKVQQLRAEQKAAEALQQWLANLLGASAEEGLPQIPAEQLRQKADSLGRAAEALFCWLASDQMVQRRKEDQRRQRRILLLLTAAVGGLAAGLALWVHPSWWLLVLVAAGLAAWAFWPLSPPDPRLPWHQELQRLQPQLAELPSQWDSASVQQYWDQLRQQIGQTELLLQLAFCWPNLQAKVDQLRQEQIKLQEQKKALVEHLGFSPKAAEEDPTWLSLLAETVRKLYEVEQKYTSSQAALQARQQEAELLARTLTTRFQQYGYPETIDSAILEAQLDDLEKRQQNYLRLLHEKSQSETRLDQLQQQIQTLQNQYHQLLENFGLQSGQEATLYTWTQLLPEYRKLRTAEVQAEGVFRAAEEAWKKEVSAGEASAAMPTPADKERLEEELRQLQQLANRQTRIAEKLGELQTQIDQAKHATQVEAALAELEQAQASLEEQRQKDYGAVVGHLLIRWLQQWEQFHPHHPVLQRGSDLFVRFTGGRYRLQLQQTYQSSLKKSAPLPAIWTALDTFHNICLSLDELSSGTRVQLLLAARMGFIEHQEDSDLPDGAVRLPMIFDETLANSDDQRAGEIIRAILELARRGRQIFYLTAQEDELRKWETALSRQTEIPFSCWRL